MKMASSYKVGTISEILAKEFGGGGGKASKSDPKLTALFSGGFDGDSSSSKVFRTVSVKEDQIFKKKKKGNANNGVGGGEGVTAKKADKKKKEDKDKAKLKLKKKEDVKLKNKDAAGIRVDAKKKVKGEMEELAVKVKNEEVAVKKSKIKKKIKKKGSKKVQEDEITSSLATAPEENGEEGVGDESPAKADKKKKKKINKKRKLEAVQEDKSEDKAPIVKAKKVKLANGDAAAGPTAGGGPLQKKGVKKTKEEKKQIRKERRRKELEDKQKAEAVKTEIKEESEDEDDDNQDEEEGPAAGPEGAFKTLEERNAPKPKDPELEARTLFVGNLPGEVKKKELMKMFKKFGKIETVRLRGGAPNKPTQLKKVAVNKNELHKDKNTLAGYIRFATREDAENAMNNGRGLMIKDNHLILDLADKQEKKDNKKAIFVGNLSLKLTDEELWRFFEDCGTILSVRVIRDGATGMGKGFGYVNFDDKEAVDKALEKNQEELKNRSIRISRCVKKPKVKKVLGMKKPGGGGPGTPKGKKFKKGPSTNDESNEYGGDRLAEIGKLKRKSAKPNRGEMHKQKIAKLLTGKTFKASTNGTNKKRYFNQNN